MMPRFPALHTLWILLFSYATVEVMAAEHMQEFACFTDYTKKLVCHWKVPTQLNCSKEFLLYYRKEYFPPEQVCVPENGEERFMCTCTIYPDYFVSGLTYKLALQFNGTSMWNSSVTPAQVGQSLFSQHGFSVLVDEYLTAVLCILAELSEKG